MIESNEYYCDAIDFGLINNKLDTRRDRYTILYIHIQKNVIIIINYAKQQHLLQDHPKIRQPRLV